MTLVFRSGRANKESIRAHLTHCDASFQPPLTSRVKLEDYARKVAERAECFEAWAEDELVGLVAVYCNAADRGSAFITSVSVLPEWHGRQIAKELMASCLAHVRNLGFERIELEVDGSNAAAIILYKKSGFDIVDQNGPSWKMTMYLR